MLEEGTASGDSNCKRFLERTLLDVYSCLFGSLNDIQSWSSSIRREIKEDFVLITLPLCIRVIRDIDSGISPSSIFQILKLGFDPKSAFHECYSLRRGSTPSGWAPFTPTTPISNETLILIGGIDAEKRAGSLDYGEDSWVIVGSVDENRDHWLIEMLQAFGECGGFDAISKRAYNDLDLANFESVNAILEVFQNCVRFFSPRALCLIATALKVVIDSVRLIPGSDLLSNKPLAQLGFSMQTLGEGLGVREYYVGIRDMRLRWTAEVLQVKTLGAQMVGLELIEALLRGDREVPFVFFSKRKDGESSGLKSLLFRIFSKFPSG